MGGGMSKIVPGIYVGGLTAAKSQPHLDHNNITHLCSVLSQDVQVPNRKQIIFRADDSPNANISQFFEDACFFIHEARVSGGSVLIHCACGVSRSVTITLAYLLVVTGLPLPDLFKAVQGARHCACPNHGFMQQLLDFETTGAVKCIREKLFSQFGEWPTENMEADKAALDEAMAIQQYYIDHGEYPGEKSLENACVDSTPEAQGKAVLEDSKPTIRPLPPTFYTIYNHGKSQNIAEFLASRSPPTVGATKSSEEDKPL